MNPVRRKFFFGTISFILFILHAVVGSLIYQAIENRFPIIERRNTTVKCLRGRELKSVIFYVNGISLTLGKRNSPIELSFTSRLEF